MNRRVIKSLYKKEMLDVLRDKKTVIMMLVVPLVVYPLMFIVGMQLMSSISSGMAHQTYKLALDFEDENDAFANMLMESKDETATFELVDDVTSPAEAINDKRIDAYISKYVETNGTISFDVYYASAITNSGYASDLIGEVIEKYGMLLSEERVSDAGLDVDYVLHPVSVSYEDTSSNEEAAGSILGMVLPFMLVVSLLLGTMYPAIDTTAGERERGTLETILTLPVSNRDLIISKFLTVATIGIVSAVLNIISMCGVGVYMYQMMMSLAEESLPINMTKFVPAIAVGILCVFAFAVFISAITMCVCSFARSYKEANNYITPLTLVVMFASFIGFIPNVELTGGMAMVPVANICLLIRDLLLIKIDIGIIVIVLVSNIAYGIIAISLLGRIYNSEAVLFGEGSGSVRIFERRSNIVRGGAPTLGDMWLVIAITAVIIIYAGGAAELALGYFGVVVTQLFIMGIPLFAAWYSKNNIKETFRLNKCGIRYYVCGIVMILGAIMLGMVLTSVTGMIFKSDAEEVSVAMDSLIGNNFFVSCFIIAVVPAICEEIMFRGYIFSSLLNRLRGIDAILLAACLFGIYHMSIVRFFTTALLGAVICFVTLKSKSIFPGMLMHFINNFLAVITMYYPEQVGKVFPVLLENNTKPLTMLLLIVAGIGFILMGTALIVNREKK